MKMFESKKVMAFGEVMLRIAMSNYQTMEQTKDARLNFTGTGLNVLSGISHFGHETALLTQLPENRLGEAAKAEIRKLGISDKLIKQEGEHMGIYLLEQGYGNRPSEVTYLERHHSSFGLSSWEELELDNAISDSSIVHICGISLILTDATRQAALRLARQAQSLGKHVCFDFNYRPSLARDQDLLEIRKAYEEMLGYADIVIGGDRDLIELLDLPSECNQELEFSVLANYFVKKYQLLYFAGTERSYQAEQRYLTGFLISPTGMITSETFPIFIFDRVGTGDAYVAGILTGILNQWEPRKLVDFATASAVLAHTTLGDSPIVTLRQVELFLENQKIDIVR